MKQKEKRGRRRKRMLKKERRKRREAGEVGKRPDSDKLRKGEERGGKC